MSISHFLPSGVLNFSESHCFFCQMNPRVGDIRKFTVWSCIHAQVLIVIIKKGLYSGSLFFLDVFLFCRQSFITEQLHFLWRLFFFVNMPIFGKWQKKLECLLNDTVLKLNRLPHDSCPLLFYSAILLCYFSLWNALGISESSSLLFFSMEMVVSEYFLLFHSLATGRERHPRLHGIEL